MPSSPPLTPRPLEMAIVSGAPAIRKTASTLPTRSTTATCARTPRACASPTACAITRSTSSLVSTFWAVEQFSVQAGGPAPLEPPPQPCNAASAAASRLMRRHTRRPLRLEIGSPRVARVVEVVAEQAVGGDLPLDRPRSAVAVAALRDLRHRDVARLLRLGHLVAIGAGDVGVRAMVEMRVRHPAVVRADRRDAPLGTLAGVRSCPRGGYPQMACLADAHLEELARHDLRLSSRERERR